MTRNTRFALLLIIILIGFVLRLYQLDATAFRGDEAFSVQRWATTPIAQSLSEIASIEPHPPLTYIVFRGWGLLFEPTNEFGLRMLPVLANLLGIPAIYAFGRRLSGQNSIGLIAAFLWAIHPFQIWHAQDFRNYGLWAGFSMVSIWLAIRLIYSSKRSITGWILYSAVALFTCLIFYNELITIGVLGLFVLLKIRQDTRFVMLWSATNGGIILLTMAAFIVFQGDLISGGDYAGTTGALQIEQWWQRFVPVLNFGDTLSATLQQQFNPVTVWWSLIVVLVFAMMGFVTWKRPQEAVLLVMLAIIPLLMLGLISTQLFIFRPRYVLAAAPAFTLIASYTFVLLWQDYRLRPASILLGLFWLALCAISLNNYYHDPAFTKSPRWRDLTGYLEAHANEDDIIIQTSVDPAFGLYYENSMIPAREFGLPANFDQSVEDIISVMQETSEQYDTIWVLGRTFPDWQNAGVVENWALDNLQLVRDANLAGLPVRQFMTWDINETLLATESQAIFGNAIALRDIDIRQSTYTNTLTVIIYWEALNQTNAPLTVFAQMIGDINPATGTPIWSQDDHPPQNGRVSTDQWQTGTIYRDVYSLSLDTVPVGIYSLLLGFYDPETGERLLLEDGTDAYIIETIIE